MIILILIFFLTFSVSVLAAPSPQEISSELLAGVQNSYNWSKDYVMAILGILMGSAIVSYYLRGSK
jgi:hypothetical protein